MATVEEINKNIATLAEVSKKVADALKSEYSTIQSVMSDVNAFMRKRDIALKELNAVIESKKSAELEIKKLFEESSQRIAQNESIAREKVSNSIIKEEQAKRELEEARVKAQSIIKKAEMGIRDGDTTAVTEQSKTSSRSRG